MNRPGRVARNLGLAAVGAGATAAAAWAAQRRLVKKSAASDQAIAEEGLVFPSDVEHRQIEVDDGGRIHVVERGSGQPLVLLHGVFLDSEIWCHQLEDLAQDHRVIAIDLRGHGLSVAGTDGFGLKSPGSHEQLEAPVEVQPTMTMQRRRRVRRLPQRRRTPPAIERLALDVRQVLEALDVENAVLVGHSMGGMVAIQAVAGMRAEERHTRLAGLMLTSTTTGPFLALPGWDLFASLGAPAALRVVKASVRSGRGVIPKGDLRWWATRVAFGADVTPAQLHLVGMMLADAEEPTMEGLLESLARVNLSGLLGSVDLPVLVTVGTHDRLTPPWHAKRLEARLADARLVELARCGHMPMLERRREFDRLLEEHTRKVS